MPIQEQYYPRTIEKVIAEASEMFKVVLLTGMRQTGKSTTLKRLCRAGRAFVSLDNARTRSEAENAPESFFIQHPVPLLLDEIQRTPSLFLQIKAEVDSRPDCGQIWATGSQKFALMKGVSESLAGRLLPLELMGLSIYEHDMKGATQVPYLPRVKPAPKLKLRSPEKTWACIWQGSWPKVIDETPRRRQFFYRALVETYLERDIHLGANVESLQSFRAFMTALAARTGQELRIGALAQAAGVAEPTVRRWLSIAEASGIIYLLRPYYANVAKQLVKSPKIYFTDTGLACYLCGISSPDALMAHPNNGAFFETFAVMEILKSWVHNGEAAAFFFYRDSKTQQEIDLLIRADGKLHPVEIKSSVQPGLAAIKNFKALEGLPEAVGHGAVVCLAPDVYSLTDRCTVHSIWAI